MSLTKEDVVTIKDIMVESFAPVLESMELRFDAIDGRLDGIDGRLDKLEFTVAGQGRSISALQLSTDSMNQKLDNIDARLQAIEADVKELYFMAGSKGEAGLKGKTLEKKILQTYQYLTDIAQEAGVVLPKTI